MRIKGMSEREILLLVVAVLVGRMHVMGMNPFAIGFFLVMCYEKIPKGYYLAALGLGFFSGYEGKDCLKYIGILLLCTACCKWLEKRKKKVSLLWYSAIGVGSVCGVEALFLGWDTATVMSRSLILMEGLLAGVFTQILYLGIHYLLTGKSTSFAGNEEILSIMVLGSLAIFGMPFQDAQAFGVLELCLSLLILVAGYRYGAGAGSLAGAIGGLLFLVRNEGLEMLGILTLLGMGAGVFRELGKMVSTLTFLGIYLVCGVYVDVSLLEIGKIRAVIVASILFLVLPKRMTGRVDTMALEQEYTLRGLEQMEKTVRRRLEHFSEPFFALSRTFSKMAGQKEDMQEKDMEDILQQVSHRLCSKCRKAKLCHGVGAHKKYETAGCILPAARANGKLEKEDFPVRFASKCDFLDQYVDTANQVLRLTCNNARWQNRLAESRQIIAEQFQDIGSLLREFSQEIATEHQLELEEKRELIAVLKRNQILVRQLEKRETNRRCQEIHLLAKARRRVCITTRELARCVSQVLDKEFVPAQESRNVLSGEYEKIVLVEATKYKTLTGVARCSKAGEMVSGDNYSFLKLDSGELVMTLADGMGSGAQACMESTSVVELMESFLEAGVREKTAIRLINSIFVLQSEEEQLSTLDLVVVNLYTGLCDFIKMGAASAFIKRGEQVETISSASLPMGVFPNVDYEDVSKKLYDGDFIILLSDGVLDAAPVENQEEYYRRIIGAMDTTNPNELANGILQQAIGDCGGNVGDDMTVLTAGVWSR